MNAAQEYYVKLPTAFSKLTAQDHFLEKIKNSLDMYQMADLY